MSSICLITIAPSDSFVHQAGDILVSEFKVTQQKILVPEKRLQEVIDTIHHNKEHINNYFETLFDTELDLNLLLEHHACIVLSNRIIPIDLIEINNKDIGRQISISHIVSENISGLIAKARKGLKEKEILLERAIFLPITRLPYGFQRIEQDLIKSALKLSNKLSVDIMLNPNIPLALSQFNRQDSQILHIDSHATSDGIQLAPFAPLSRLEDFQLPVSVPLILLMACSTVKNHDSIGQQLSENGASTIIGFFFDWLTGSLTNDISNPDMYNTFFDCLLSGETVGNALVAAKKKSVLNIDNASLLLIGNQFLRFKTKI